MNESRPKSHRWRYIAFGTVAALAALFYYRTRPTVLAETHSPHRAGGYIRIVEVPTHWLDALTFRYNPYYRFEFHWPGDYLWSAATFSGESYNAQTASITWNPDSTAIVFLDGHPYFQLRDHLWYSTK